MDPSATGPVRARAAQGVRQGSRAGPRGRRRQPRRRPGRVGGDRRPERLRQVDAPVPARRPRTAHGRHRSAGRRAGSSRCPRQAWPACGAARSGSSFQAFHLVDELTALENVELPALLAGASPRKAARARATELLEQVGLEDRAEHLPSALSGGQRQRVAIARALANAPRVVLADEPTGNLDSAATTEVLRLFEQLHADGQTLVIVTHDARIAATADRLITMRDGRFVDETKLTGGTRPQRHRDRRARGLTAWAGSCSSRASSSATSSAGACSPRSCC